MSYQHERDRFVARMAQEGLPLEVTTKLLRAATTLQRYAELACSSEAADRDRVPCPAVKGGPCLCDSPADHNKEHLVRVRGDDRWLPSVPRITVLADRLERRIVALLDAANKDLARRPSGMVAEGTGRWIADFQGDPRGYVLRVIPPSYAERNKGKDRFNVEAIGVPSGPTRLRF